MYKKIISATLLIFFSTVFASAGVTNIKEIVNNTSGIVGVYKSEYNFHIPRHEKTDDIPSSGVWSGDMWIPWVTNEYEFLNHRMRIEIRIPGGNQNGSYKVTQFSIWQSGDFVRYTNKSTFVANAPKVPGESKVDGERRLIVSEENKKIVFKFEQYKK